MAVLQTTAGSLPSGPGVTLNSSDKTALFASLLGIPGQLITSIERWICPAPFGDIGESDSNEDFFEICIQDTSLTPLATPPPSKRTKSSPAEDTPATNKTKSTNKTSTSTTSGSASTSTTSATSLSETARDILIKGCMPLIPTARRDWATCGQVTIHRGDIKLEWPPRGWKVMTPDTKLLHWEFAAMHMESSMTDELLDKYNFLALPGTIHPQHSSSTEDTHVQKIRIFNYKMLVDIALGKQMGHTEQSTTTFVDMIRKAATSRYAYIDNLLEQLNKIPLRLEA